MKRELMAVIDQLGREKGIDKERVLSAVESALLTAAKKRYGNNENIHVQVDQGTGEISIVSLKTIAETVTDDKCEISLAEARTIDAEAEIGDEIGSVIEMEEFGRIAAQAAKQVICQKGTASSSLFIETIISPLRWRAEIAKSLLTASIDPLDSLPSLFIDLYLKSIAFRSERERISMRINAKIIAALYHKFFLIFLIFDRQIGRAHV